MVAFLHTADTHLGKTYRITADEAKRYEDFIRTLGGIVSDATIGQIDFVLNGGDLFQTGKIPPRTFCRSIETLQPLFWPQCRTDEDRDSPSQQGTVRDQGQAG